MEKVTREDVVHAYKIYLGRMPESEECFLGRVGVIEKNSLKNQFLQSKEHSLKAEESMIDFVVICHIPDDCIDKNRYPLFMARSVLRELIESLPSTRSL